MKFEKIVYRKVLIMTDKPCSCGEPVVRIQIEIVSMLIRFQDKL